MDRVGALGPPRVGGPADRAGRGERSARGQRERLAAHHLQEPLRQHLARPAVGPAADDQELLAAPAEHRVGVAGGLAQADRDLHQHLVPSGVAGAVVELLEVIDVEEVEDQVGIALAGGRRAEGVAHRLAQVRLEAHRQEPAVAQAGQRIGERGELEPAVGRGQLAGALGHLRLQDRGPAGERPHVAGAIAEPHERQGVEGERPAGEPRGRPDAERDLDGAGDGPLAVHAPDAEGVAALGQAGVVHLRLGGPGGGVVLQAGELRAVAGGVLAAIAEQGVLKPDAALVVAQRRAGRKRALPAGHQDFLEP